MTDSWRLPEDEWLSHFPTIRFEHWLQLAHLRAESLRHLKEPDSGYPKGPYNVSADLGHSILDQLMQMQLIVDFDYMAWEHHDRFWDTTKPDDFDSLDPLTLGKILLIWHRQEHWTDNIREPFTAGTGQAVLAALIRKAGHGHLLEK